MPGPMSRRSLLAGGVLSTLLAAPGRALASPPSSPDPAPGPADLWLGQVGRRVDVVEYGSLDCPHCAEFAATALPSIRSAYVATGGVRYSFRDLPLDKAALRAAVALRGAADPQQRVDFASFLFSRRPEWTDAPDVDAVMLGYLLAAAVPEATARALLADPAQRASVLASRQRGIALGVTTTPTFFVNGTMVRGDVGASGLANAIVEAASR